ncbi:MAG: type II toxin-antitoxin system RelE/ParE family toxin [Bryobacteraceae bacterium]
MGRSEGRTRTALSVTVIFTRSARSELLAAQDWYESEVPGLGRRFRAEIDTAVARICANPVQFPVVHRDIRRVIVRRFPHLLFFVLEDRAAFVLACFHASRDPGDWQSR